MANLRSAKDAVSTKNWNENFKPEIYQIAPKGERIRLFDKLVGIKTHRVDIISPTKGPTGYQELCLNWDPVSEKEVDGDCPMCAEGAKQSQEFWGYQMNRRARAKSGEILLKIIRFTGVAAAKLADLSNKVYLVGDEEVDDQRKPLPEGFDESDPPGADHRVHGFDFTIKKTEKNGKTEYEVDSQPGWVTSLTDDEIEAFDEYAQIHDIGRAARKGQLSPAAFRAKLQKSSGQPQQQKRPPAKTQAERDRAAFDDEDQIPEDDAPPQRQAAKAAKTQAVKPQAKPQVRAKASLSGDDDEDEHVRNYAGADASDAPDADDDNPF